MHNASIKHVIQNTYRILKVLSTYIPHLHLFLDTIFTVPLISHDIDRQPRVRRSEQSSQYMNIILPTPNKDVVLRMEASDSLLVPGATYELRKGNVSTATPVRNDCFFQGKVVGSNDSFVALSVCNGLVRN